MTRPGEDDVTRADEAATAFARAPDPAPEITADDARPVSRGRYRLGAMLGEGGMAIVVEAEDVNLKRPVAVKQLRDGLRGDTSAERRFFAEAEILAGLDHAGVVSVHEAGVLEDGAPFYAMAKVKGPTLADLLQSDAGASVRVSMRHVEVVQRAAETMGYAHARGLIHLDLKPQNIMVDEDGAVYVMDWGIARRTSGPVAAERGLLRGTPAYMSPEVAAGRGDLADPRSDVFALGVILYEVLTGQRPFRGDTASLLKAVATVTPPVPRRVARHVPRELSAICMKALSKDPASRYPTARELARDIRDYRDFLPVSAMRPTLRDRVVKWMRRHPRATTAIVTAAIALLVAGGVRAYRVAAERAMVETLWSQYEAINADLDQLEAQLAEVERARPANPEQARRNRLARAEVQERLDLRANDARSVAGAMLGVTRGVPDPRLVRALSTRLRHDVERARAEGNLVRVKVLAETRLELIDDLGGQFVWPEEEKEFLRRTLEQANREIDQMER
jgi:hypothetical protein